jgi:hypothetical protein
MAIPIAISTQTGLERALNPRKFPLLSLLNRESAQRRVRGRLPPPPTRPYLRWSLRRIRGLPGISRHSAGFWANVPFDRAPESPRSLACADRALFWLRPSGQLVVLDSFLRSGHPIANWVVRTKAPHVGAVPEDLPLDALLARLHDPRTQSHLLGSYILVPGCKR